MTVVVPDLGGQPATLSVWHARDGDRVAEGERLVEVLIPGAVVDLSAPASGRFRRLVPAGGELAAGAVVGRVDPCLSPEGGHECPASSSRSTAPTAPANRRSAAASPSA